MTTVASRIVDFLVLARWPLFALAMVIAALAWYPAQQVRFDRSVENMFAPDDPLLPPYQRLKRDFGGNEIVMAVYQDDYFFSADGSGIRRNAELASRLKAVPGVRDVLSLAQVNDLLEKLQAGKKAASLFNLFGSKKKEEPFKGPAILHPSDPLAARYRDLFSGYTHSADGKTAAVVCMLEPAAFLPSPLVGEGPGVRGQNSTSAGENHDPRRATIKQLESIIQNPPGGLRPGVVTGEPVMVSEGFALLEEDGRRLGTWTTLLLGLTILVFFRSIRWLLVPIVTVQWTLLVTRAALVLSGLQLSMVSSMLTAVVTVIGVATVMHLTIDIRERRAHGSSPLEAFRQAAGPLAWPILGAILTDVVGFGSLWWADVGPVQDFGTMMVVGSLVVIPAVCLIVPALATAGFLEWGDYPAKSDESRLAAALARSVHAIQARPLAVAAVSLTVALIAAIGAVRLEVESDFTRNFRRASLIVHAYDFVETRLGGAGVWDILIPAPDTLDKDYLARVRRLEERLREIRFPGSGVVRGSDATIAKSAKPRSTPDPLRVDQATGPSAGQSTSGGTVSAGGSVTSKGSGFDGESRLEKMEGGRSPTTPDPAPALTKVMSLVDAIDAIDVDPTLAMLTPSAEIRAQGVAAAMPAFTAALRSPPDEQGQARLRIMLRAYERQPADQKRWLIDEVTRIAREEFPPSEKSPGAEVTGFFVLLTNLIESMLGDQWTTFFVCTIGIFAMLLVAFRSFKLSLIALVPNLLPIYVVMGMMGWLGLKMNMGAAMIAAVSMGQTVDSSLHYLVFFQRARRGGMSVNAALTSVQQTVGQSMIFSTIALIIGFGVLITSEFVPTIYFGALMSLAMLGGLFGNLVALPLLLSWSEHDDRRVGQASEASADPRGAGARGLRPLART
jgi:predicted RND superfamily exporter protein